MSRRSPTTRAATAIAPSARAAPRCAGSRIGRPICCPCSTSTSSSRCRRRSPPSPITTRRWSTACCSTSPPRRCGRIAADPKHLGARIGATLVLHTWGSALTHHPHVHGIVPGGGLAPDSDRWVRCRPGFFLPVRVLSRLFRRRFLEALIAAHDAGSCTSSASMPSLPTRRRSASGLRPCAAMRVGRLRQAPLRRPQAGAGVSLPLHAPRGHLQPPADSPSTSAASPSAGRTTEPRAGRVTRR